MFVLVFVDAVAAVVVEVADGLTLYEEWLGDRSCHCDAGRRPCRLCSAFRAQCDSLILRSLRHHISYTCVMFQKEVHSIDNRML